jgi:hypothetical protein
MAKIVVTSTPKNRILINNRTGGLGGGAGAVDTIVELRDVDASSLDNNETLVYDEASDKFVVKVLPVINGGNF